MANDETRMANEMPIPNELAPSTRVLRPWYRIHFSTLSVLVIVLACLVFINIPGDRTSVISDRYSHGWPYHYYEREGADGSFWSFTGTSPEFKVVPLLLNLLTVFCIAALVALPCEIWIRRNGRLFCFGLRSMFLVTTALAVLMGLGVREVHQCYRQNQTLRDLAELGSLSASRRMRNYDWFRSMFGQGFEGTITTVEVVASQPTKGRLPDLSALRHVEFLTLEKFAVAAFDMEQLASLPKLHGMSVRLTEFHSSDAPALRDLTAFPKLHYLRLSGDSFTDETVEHFSPEGQIQRLFVGSTKITSRGMMKLSELTLLLYVWLDKASLRSHDWAILAEIPNLHLTIIDNKLTANDEARLRTAFQKSAFEAGKTIDTGEKYLSFERDRPLHETIGPDPGT